MGEVPEGRGLESKGISLRQTLVASFIETEGKVRRLCAGQVMPQVWWLIFRDFLSDSFYFLCEEEES